MKYIEITFDNGYGYYHWCGHYKNKHEAVKDFRKNYPHAEIIEVEVYE